eukprot:TRINITY_DN42966_c0_g1_i1.p1 TRINITY_DN42966_c0_g1~~TRINITY_DN42966_c0_g1_i1.p1  ORF type:complete len:363 (-),score=53.18 TRINITY_DN42966_c0_g1_i1:161-1090(-)
MVQKQAARRGPLSKCLYPIIARYGFEASWQGVMESQSCGGPWGSDPEIVAKFQLQKWLLDPSLQKKQPLPELQHGDLALAVKRIRESIEEKLGSHSLAAPLCSAHDAPKTARLVPVALPWAQVLGHAPLACAVVEGVLLPEEVQALRSWGLTRSDWVLANNHLVCQFMDGTFADKLWQRLVHLIPQFQSMPALGLNDHLRLLRYGPGHYFLPHQDGENRSKDGRSRLSALLYLSEPEAACAGGSTRFISPDCQQISRFGRCDYVCDRCVDAPVGLGSLLIFAQTLVHAGTEPQAVEKYVMRTDVMYPVQ